MGSKNLGAILDRTTYASKWKIKTTFLLLLLVVVAQGSEPNFSMHILQISQIYHDHESHTIAFLLFAGDRKGRGVGGVFYNQEGQH